MGQETDRPDALPVPADTSETTLEGTLPDTTARPDLTGPEPGGPALDAQLPASGPNDLQRPVHFSSSDSLAIVFSDTTGDIGTLFGNASVTYGDARLAAHRVDLLFDLNELRASGLPSDTGLVGRPQFNQSGESFAGNELAFNLRTERGRVIGARTNIEDGFIKAGVVKMTEDSTIYIAHGAYTTCECEDDPSYTLRSRRMKIVDQEWIYTGPIQLYLFNIPTPLWLPFGFLPAQEGRRSGPLPPRYGEDERGFYLRGWGWYQALSDYTDFQIEFGLWTLGSWQAAPRFRYARRYAYFGELALDYGRSRSGERDDPDFQKFSTTSIRWSHRQEINPTSSFNANVNLSSRNYLRTVSELYDDRVRQTIQSSVRYSKSWRESGRNLSVDLNHRQQLATGDVSATLPSLRFSQSQRKPFQRGTRVTGSNERWYERLTYNYSGSLDNRYSFAPLAPSQLVGRPDSAEVADITWLNAMFSPDRYRQATGNDAPFEFSVSHRVSSSANFTINRIPIINRALRLNVSPTLNYTEDWFPRTERRVFDEESSTVERNSVSDWLALRQFSTGISSNTTFYGIFPIRIGPFEGLRHTVRPSLGFSYRPDFFDPFWGYTETYIQNGREVRYPIVTGVQSGQQKALNFSVGNVFETKRVRADTTGDTSRTQQVLQLLNLDFNSSYNFAADSFKMAPIRLTARSRLFDQVDIRASSTLSPYALNEGRSREINRFLFQRSPFSLARLTQLNVSLNTRFQSRQRGSDRPIGTSRSSVLGNTLDPTLGESFDPTLSPMDAAAYPSSFDPTMNYADFAIPWSLTVSLTYNYSRNFQTIQGIRQLEDTFNAILNTSFDFNLTPNWKVQGRSGYDFKQDELVFTSVSIFRDFECWEMGISWVPFGPYQSYSFDLHVKSGHLRDILRLRQPRSDVGGRFGGLPR